MKSMKKTVALLLISTLSISPVLEAVAQEQLKQVPEAGKVIVISEIVGETIDLEERNYYGLFLFSPNFQSAVILQMPDSSYVAQISEENKGVRKLRTLPINRQALDKLREHIDNFKKLTPADRARFFSPPQEHPRKAEILKAKIIEARKQAKIMAKEKWTKERWREEGMNDRGPSYRTSGALVGLLAGSAAGMLIGKGFQGKKVRQVVHEIPGYYHTEWEGPPSYVPTSYRTENFYSYKHKHSSHLGAAIGGTVGTVAGYFLGKKADKKYYILVPKDIRMEETNSSWLGNFLFGFGVTGIAMGVTAGRTLYTPIGGKKFGGSQFLDGYIVGAIMGTEAMMGYNGRTKRMQLWEESILEQKPESSLDIRVIPLDQAAFCVLTRTLPSGEIFYEYRTDLLRIRF